MRFLVLMLLPMCVFADSVYRWQDAQGNIYLSDKPRDGAEKIPFPKDEPTKMQFSSPEMPPVPDRKTAAKGQYHLLAIIKPQPDSTAHNGTLAIEVEVNPTLFSGDSVEIYLDGQRVASSSSSLNFTVHNVDRGTHSLIAKIVGQDGDIKATSQKTVVHMPVSYTH